MFTNSLKSRYSSTESARGIWQIIHIDAPLLLAVLMLILYGIVILYSASGQNMVVIQKQLFRLGVGLIIMLSFAQINPIVYRNWAPALYILGVILLIAVLIVGHIGKGGQRWINLGFIRFQPSEMMKLAIPLFLAYYFHRIHLPLSYRAVIFSGLLIIIPVFLTAKQPDLGTGILLAVAGGSVLFLAGLSGRLMSLLAVLITLALPILWFVMYDYQRQRVITFLNPERDPLGKGYHIIQSKIAIGSGGFFGKGWLNGTQSHLHFLPEHSTDFIFGVCGEELGFLGSLILIALMMTIVLRALYITVKAQDTFTRLLAGSLTLTFFASFFINMGMVTGILPVVGLPLPLVSYGGSYMVTLMASFGILMSIQTHRKLLTT